MSSIGGQTKYPVSNLLQQTSGITTHIEAQAKEWINALIDIEKDANLPLCFMQQWTEHQDLAEMHQLLCVCWMSQ